jgi:hypothetical protein
MEAPGGLETYHLFADVWLIGPVTLYRFLGGKV